MECLHEECIYLSYTYNNNMEKKTTVGPKGQVVIPKEIRDKIGIKEYSEVIVDIIDLHLCASFFGFSSAMNNNSHLISKPSFTGFGRNIDYFKYKFVF